MQFRPHSALETVPESVAAAVDARSSVVDTWSSVMDAWSSVVDARSSIVGGVVMILNKAQR